jgi:hypothetical protein
MDDYDEKVDTYMLRPLRMVLVYKLCVDESK